MECEPGIDQRTYQRTCILTDGHTTMGTIEKRQKELKMKLNGAFNVFFQGGV